MKRRLSLKFVKEAAREMLLSVEKVGRNRYEIFNNATSVVVCGGLNKVAEAILGNNWQQLTGYTARINVQCRERDLNTEYKPLPE